MKKKLKKFIWFVVIIAIVAGIGYVYLSQKYGTVSVNTPAQEQVHQQLPVTATDNELQSIIDDPKFQASMKLEARKIRADREKKAELTRHETALTDEKQRNEVANKRIETELEAIRAEELQLGGTKATFQ